MHRMYAFQTLPALKRVMESRDSFTERSSAPPRINAGAPTV